MGRETEIEGSFAQVEIRLIHFRATVRMSTESNYLWNSRIMGRQKSLYWKNLNI